MDVGGALSPTVGTVSSVPWRPNIMRCQVLPLPHASWPLFYQVCSLAVAQSSSSCSSAFPGGSSRLSFPFSSCFLQKRVALKLLFGVKWVGAACSERHRCCRGCFSPSSKTQPLSEWDAKGRNTFSLPFAPFWWGEAVGTAPRALTWWEVRSS